MKLIANIDSEETALDFRREDKRVFAEIDGRKYQLDAREIGRGLYLVVHDGQVHEVYFSSDSTQDQKVSSPVEIVVRRAGGEKVFQISLSDPKRLRASRASAGHDAGRASIASPMPGKVVRVLVEQGQTVEIGEGLLVVEAMKMQNEMKSPKAGTVVELHAQTGATVNAGEVLAVIE